MSSPPGDRGGGDGASGTQIMELDASFRCQPPCEEMEQLHIDAGGGATELASAKQQEETSSIAAEADVSPTSSPFWARRNHDWGLSFYIRVDSAGSFHTYPDVGGPFQSMQEAKDAIDRHLHARRAPTMCMEQAGVSRKEMIIRTILYRPDGTRKKCSKSKAIERACDDKRRLVQSLVDNYNEDHNLLGDIAYQLKDVVHYNFIREELKFYYHFNFTAKTKGADDFDSGIDNLFFAEVKFMQQGGLLEFVVSCFCMVKPIDNDMYNDCTRHCYGCTNRGIVDMKHPNKASAYTGGHLDVRPYRLLIDWDSEDEEAEEKRIRDMYKVYGRVKKSSKLRSGVTPSCKRKKGAGVKE